jgi:hypothetical protein
MGALMTTTCRIAACAFFAGAHLFAASPALALDIQPGLWQDTETGETNGKPVPRQVSTECVSPADAKDIVQRARADLQASMKDQAQHCSKLDIRQDGNVVTFEMKCGDPKQGSIDAAMVMTVHSPQHMTSVAKTTMSIMGQTMISNTTTESKWIAATCKK